MPTGAGSHFIPDLLLPGVGLRNVIGEELHFEKDH